MNRQEFREGGQEAGMDKTFRDLALYHAQYNLPLCLPAINSGKPAPDGKEFDQHPGTLILKNGPQTIRDLIKQGLVNPEMVHEAQSVSNRHQLQDYLQRFGGEDGIHVLDTSNGLMYWVYQVGNKLSTQPATPFLPSNFLGAVPLQEGKLGNRTRLGVHLPREMAKQGTHLDTYLIKQTPVNGIGTLSHFTEQGLVELMYHSPRIVGDGSSQADVTGAKWVYERYGQGKTGPSILESRLWSAPKRELTAPLQPERDYVALEVFYPTSVHNI
ncbi:MAG: hypothetical protein ABIH82_02510 [Candidatus Woesearchaeota archaeon]